MTSLGETPFSIATFLVCLSSVSWHVVEAAAADLPSAVIRGTVSSQGGGVPEDARVTLVCQGDPTVDRTSAPAGDGNFVFADLPTGPCSLQVRASGHRSATVEDMVLAPHEDRQVHLVLMPSHNPPARSRGSTRTVAFDGVPLPSRSVGGALLGAGAFGELRHDPQRGLYRIDRLHLDGFDITDPFDRRQVVRVPLDAITYFSVAQLSLSDPGKHVSGTVVDIGTTAGSNRFEGTAIGTYSPDTSPSEAGPTVNTGSLGVSASGPLNKDRLWFAATAEVGGSFRSKPDDFFTDRQRLGKLTWQANARNKLSLLWTGSPAAQLLGLTWQSLLTDALVASVRVAGSAWNTQVPSDPVKVQRLEGVGTLQWFWDNSVLGDHALSVTFAGQRLDHGLVPTPAALTESFFRLRSVVSDHWRITRHLTIAPAVGLVSEHADTMLESQLGLAWDATHDGRTAVRAAIAFGAETQVPSASETSTDGAFALDVERRQEVAIGVDREVLGRLRLGGRYVEQRWTRPGPDQLRWHRSGILEARLREGPLSFGAYLSRSWEDPRENTRAPPWGGAVRAAAWFSRWFGLAVAVAYEDRQAWARALGNDSPFDAGGGSANNAKALLVNLRTALDLGPLLGVPVLVLCDGLDFLGTARRGTDGPVDADSTETEVQPTGRIFRLSLRMPL